MYANVLLHLRPIALPSVPGKRSVAEAVQEQQDRPTLHGRRVGIRAALVAELGARHLLGPDDVLSIDEHVVSENVLGRYERTLPLSSAETSATVPGRFVLLPSTILTLT